MAGAVASFSAMAVAGREIGAALDTFEIMLYRSLVGVALVWGFAAVTGRTVAWRTRRPGLHVLRNLAHFTGQNLWFAAVTLIPLAQLFAIEFTSPLWVALLAPFLLGEALGVRRAAAVAAGFGGILLVAEPWAEGGLAPGTILAAVAATAFAGTAIATKVLTRTESLLTILIWLTGAQAAMGAICAGWDGEVAWPTGAAGAWVLLVGVTGLAAHLSLTRALSLAPASAVMPVDFARLPVIAVVGALLYGETFGWTLALGATVILLANWVNLREAARG
nr:DMT family transporter [Hasllibacter halocynthiae]